MLDHGEGDAGAQDDAGRAVHGAGEHRGRVETGHALQHQGHGGAQHEEDAQRAQQHARFPAHAQTVGPNGRAVEGDGRAQQAGTETGHGAQCPGMGDAAAGAEGLLPVDVIEQEQAHGALQHGAGTDLEDVEPGKGPGHRGQQHGPQGADAAEAEMQAGQTDVHDHVDDAGQGDGLVHRQEHDQEGKGHHGAADAADAGNETACDPSEEHTDLSHPGHTPLLRPRAAPISA